MNFQEFEAYSVWDGILIPVDFKNHLLNKKMLPQVF